MWPDQRLCISLGIEHPIIQAPMAGSATPLLASAVSGSGGLGSPGSAEMTLAELHAAVAAMRRATNRPFNLNFFVHDALTTDPAHLAGLRQHLRPWYEKFGLGDPPADLPPIGPGFDAAHLALLLDLRPAVVSFHFGVPDRAANAALKSAGIVLLSTATTVADGRSLQASGIDAVIAQGWEAGGHRGSHSLDGAYDGVGTFALLPQIADAVQVPVIAAGGVGDGRGIAAAFALGASGVQIGTGFLSCPEAGTDAARRALLRHATDQDTMVTPAFSGRPARAHRSRFAEAMAAFPAPLAAFRQMYALSGPIEAAASDQEASIHLCGQAAALNREEPAAVLLARLVAEANADFGRLSAPKR